MLDWILTYKALGVFGLIVMIIIGLAIIGTLVYIKMIKLRNITEVKDGL